MTRRRWLLFLCVALVAVVVTGALALAFTGRGPALEADAPAATATDPGVDERDGEARPADELGAEFLEDWVENGRVVRRDQGGDTVSEGQAYGMLIAVGIGDEKSFDTIWDWTKDNLVRDDGLLAWRFDDGAIVDDEPASDADLDVARALVLAGDRFGLERLTEEGNSLATRILDRMTVETAAGRILLPGMWAAATEPYAYNPSYASPAAFALLGASTGDTRFTELAAGSTAVTSSLLALSDLPPDWAQVHADGSVDAMPGPVGTGADVRYSYDAARLALRYAESCTVGDVAIAGELAPTLTRNDVLPAELDLGGGALDDTVHPLAYGARAASLAASGDPAAARTDLEEAITISDSNPTYYGSAWVALTSLLLESDRLGGCPPLEE